MIGVSKEDMKDFQVVLNTIIEAFNSPETTLKLLRTQTLDEFITALSQK